MTYDEAQREAEALLKKLDLQSFIGVRLSDDEITLADTLRAILAGPPEPTEEEVRLTIRGVIGVHIIDGRMAELAAQAVHALLRSQA